MLRTLDLASGNLSPWHYISFYDLCASRIMKVGLISGRIWDRNLNIIPTR